MKIIPIVEDYIYSIQYDDETKCEYVRIFDGWHDLDAIIEFFDKYSAEISDYLCSSIGLRRDEPEKFAKRVIDEADELEGFLLKVAENSKKGYKPDLMSIFKTLDGKYTGRYDQVPVKAYGTKKPSLLRIYAIELDVNCCLIVYGGIKIRKTIQESPVLKDMVFRRIDETLEYLFDEGITQDD